ncbi:MAG: hypothetical protein ACXACA_06075, partial [Candidatus Ranarchaeia archaeon]
MSPPYTIDVNVGAGVNSCLLRQRFNTNSGLWGKVESREIYLNGSFVVKNMASGNETLAIKYLDSVGGTPIQILNAEFSTSYVLKSGSTTNFIPESPNTASGSAGYVDVYLEFQPNSHVQVSQVQVYPSLGAATNFVPDDLSSSNREQAYQGDYYIPEVIQKPVESFLVGWDFPLNPRQFVDNTSTIESTLNASNAYILDQTIAQKTATGGLTITRDVDSVTGGMRISKTGVGGSFYVAQYVDPLVAKKIVSNRLSVNVNGYRDLVGTDVTVRVYLLIGTTDDNFPDLASNQTLGTIQDNGTFDVNATGWKEIPRSNLPTAQATLSVVS